jgi:hypothetical protein
MFLLAEVALIASSSLTSGQRFGFSPSRFGGHLGRVSDRVSFREPPFLRLIVGHIT